MTQPPERIWATEDADNFGEDRFHTTQPTAGLNEYILATSEALAASPEVQALIADAVKAERALCLKAIADLPTPTNEDIMRGHEDAYRAVKAAAEIRTASEALS